MLKSVRSVAFTSVSSAPMRRPAGQLVRVTSVSPAPMRRPAGRPVRSSADLAWCARALEALQQACRAFELRYGPELQREFGLAVHCTYTHETASQQHDPQDWTVPSDGRCSHCKVTFEIGFVGGMSVSTEASFNDIVSKGRFIQLPQQFLTRLRKRKAEAKAAEATKTSGCPCMLRGWVGQEEGEEITTETKLSYEWCPIRTVAGQPYTVQIKYRDLITQERPVPNCPMPLPSRPRVHNGLPRSIR